MRTIKFRGKRVDNGDWVYGVPSYGFSGKKIEYIMPTCYFATRDMGQEDDNGNPIIENEMALGGFIPIHPETIGQFTGLHDKDGNEIYEGDYISTDLQRPYNKVIYKNGCFMFQCFDDNLYHDIFYPTEHLDTNSWSYGKVIGNIHDNPELIKEDN